MKNEQNIAVESRRGFLKKSVYMAPVIIMLGSLNAYATDKGDSKAPGNSTLKACKQNNGFGNGDQNAPGNSLNHNGAENDTTSDKNAKNKVNNVGVDTHGGHEKDLADEKSESDKKNKS